LKAKTLSACEPAYKNTAERFMVYEQAQYPWLRIPLDWAIGCPQDGSSVAAVDTRTHPDALGCQVL
jgi:hypothetical protein